MTGRLLGQAVVAQCGPMTYSRRLDEGHRDLELVERQASWYCSRERVGTPSQTDDPAGLGEVVQSLADVAWRDPEGGGEAPRTFSRKDPISDLRKHAGEFGPRRAMYEMFRRHCSSLSNICRLQSIKLI